MTKNTQTNKDGEKSMFLFCSVFFLLSLGCVIFGVLLLAGWNGVEKKNETVNISQTGAGIAITFAVGAANTCARHRRCIRFPC